MVKIDNWKVIQFKVPVEKTQSFQIITISDTWTPSSQKGPRGPNRESSLAAFDFYLCPGEREQQRGICNALGENCCLYANKFGIVPDSLQPDGLQQFQQRLNNGVQE